MFWKCVLACVYAGLFCVLCVFVVGCGSLASNEDIVRFSCGDGKSYILL